MMKILQHYVLMTNFPFTCEPLTMSIFVIHISIQLLVGTFWFLFDKHGTSST
jgi:hypothetical protein